MKQYPIRRSDSAPVLSADAADPVWASAEEAHLDEFRPEGSSHRPRTVARALWNAGSLFVLFTVDDRYVRSVHTTYGTPTFCDSCVEWYIQAEPSGPYVSIEVNCGGTMWCLVIRDPRRTPGGFADWRTAAPESAARIEVFHSLPSRVDPEIAGPVTWRVALRIPFEFLRDELGASPVPGGPPMRGNFYKCGDETSHPHWAAWSPVAELNFHRPQDFGEFILEP